MVSPNKSSSGSRAGGNAAERDNIERAKDYLIQAILKKKPEVVTQILQGGFPVDEPLVDHSR